MCSIVRYSSQNMKQSDFSFPKVFNFLRTYMIGRINFKRLSNDVISSPSLPIEGRYSFNIFSILASFSKEMLLSSTQEENAIATAFVQELLAIACEPSLLCCKLCHVIILLQSCYHRLHFL